MSEPLREAQRVFTGQCAHPLTQLATHFTEAFVYEYLGHVKEITNDGVAFRSWRVWETGWISADLSGVEMGHQERNADGNDAGGLVN
jgi:hypothetical protein